MTTLNDLEKIAQRAYLADLTGDGGLEPLVHAEHLPHLLRRLGAPQPQNPVLEMGFGEGTITASLLATGYRVSLIEGSAALCESARRRFGDALEIHCSYFENFVPTRKFDHVLCLHILEHVDQPEAVVTRMRSWLTANGHVIAVVPNAESLHRQIAVQIGLQPQLDTLSPRDVHVGHQRVFDLAQLRGLFEENGFEVVETFGYFVKVVPNSMMMNWSPEIIRGLTAISGLLPTNLLANIGLLARPCR